MQLFTDQLLVTKSKKRQKRDGDQRNSTITQKRLLASFCEKSLPIHEQFWTLLNTFQNMPSVHVESTLLLLSNQTTERISSRL